MCRNDALHPLEHLQAALRLARLRGRRPKAIHEGGDLRDAPHLAGVQGRLQCQFLGARILELRVVAGVGADGSILDMQHTADDGIEELAIVRNHQQRARVARQPLLQPDDGVEVEVIGGLIQQQKIGARTQRSRHRQPHAPAAGKIGHRALVIRDLNPSPCMTAAARALALKAPDCLERRIEICQRQIRSAPFGLLYRGLHAAQFQIAVQHELDGGLLRWRRSPVRRAPL